MVIFYYIRIYLLSKVHCFDIISCWNCWTTKTKDFILLRKLAKTCKFSLLIYMSINKRWMSHKKLPKRPWSRCIKWVLSRANNCDPLNLSSERQFHYLRGQENYGPLLTAQEIGGELQVVEIFTPFFSYFPCDGHHYS